MDPVKELENLALNLINFKEEYEREDDFQIVLRTELSLIDKFAEVVKEGGYETYLNENIQTALENAMEDIKKYMSEVGNKIRTTEDQIRKCDIEENEIREKNQEITWKKGEKEKELQSLGLFKGERKRELKKEIAELKYLEPPYDFEQKREELKGQIKRMEKDIYPYSEGKKKLAFAWDKCKINIKPGQTPFRKETNTMEQESQNTASEAPVLKDLKKVHIPDLKPLKRL